MQLCWKNFLKPYLASTTNRLKKRETWRLCPLGWTAIGTIGTSEGLGPSNTT